MENLSSEQKKRMIDAGQAALHMSHGVKNLLQAIRSSREIMDSALDSKDICHAQRAWDILQCSLDRIEKLTLDTLKYSHEDAPNYESCEFNRLVKSVVQTVRPQGDKRNIEILTQFDHNIKQVAVDPEQMQDVVMNLLMNAIEAIEDHAGEIVVETELDADRKQVILRVGDNGRGLEDAERIFEPFYSTKSNVGTGLGLAITQKVVQSHGGTIGANSSKNEGTTVSVQIPMDGN